MFTSQSLNGIIKVDFEIIVSQLELRGARKTKAEVLKGYRMLASNPNSGLSTCKTVRWRRIWDQVYRVKRHLEEEGLVLPPQDYTDPFFHVPALENGHDTSWHFKTLLKKSGYTDLDHPIMDVQGGFWATYLPRLLRREVWERITGKPASPYYSLFYIDNNRNCTRTYHCWTSGYAKATLQSSLDGSFALHPKTLHCHV